MGWLDLRIYSMTNASIKEALRGKKLQYNLNTFCGEKCKQFSVQMIDTIIIITIVVVE